MSLTTADKQYIDDAMQNMRKTIIEEISVVLVDIMNRIDERFNRIEKRMDRIEERLDSIETRFGSVELTLADHATKWRKLSAVAKS